MSPRRSGYTRGPRQGSVAEIDFPAAASAATTRHATGAMPISPARETLTRRHDHEDLTACTKHTKTKEIFVIFVDVHARRERPLSRSPRSTPDIIVRDTEE